MDLALKRGKPISIGSYEKYRWLPKDNVSKLSINISYCIPRGISSNFVTFNNLIKKKNLTMPLIWLGFQKTFGFINMNFGRKI